MDDQLQAHVPTVDCLNSGLSRDVQAQAQREGHAAGGRLIPVAALFVMPNGSYAGLPGVDLWDEARDARLYAGPHPVVAHPPCSRWCQLAGLVEARWGHKRHKDGGCFAAALEAVRTYGGVLEHPAYTAAFDHHGIPAPNPHGGWQRLLCGGWVCHVEQGRYGHRARKATWLYYHGRQKPPAMLWGQGQRGDAVVGYCRNRRAADDGRPTVTKRECIATPHAFRDTLLAIARNAR